MAFTFFFRDTSCLEQAVAHLVSATGGRTRVRIWDAGCAMGQEPYTLAIMLAESMGQFAFRNLQITASDVDEPLLRILEQAVYSKVELDRIPEDIFKKYFQPYGANSHFRVVDKIRQAVTPVHHDLLTLKPLRDDFSLIVCKNVLLHFQPGERIEVYKMFYSALEPGGLLVNEHTQKMPAELSRHFEQVVPDGQLFRKVEGKA
jgi:chemotaxis protein methyltransferase CheR